MSENQNITWIAFDGGPNWPQQSVIYVGHDWSMINGTTMQVTKIEVLHSAKVIRVWSDGILLIDIPLTAIKGICYV